MARPIRHQSNSSALYFCTFVWAQPTNLALLEVTRDYSCPDRSFVVDYLGSTRPRTQNLAHLSQMTHGTTCLTGSYMKPTAARDTVAAAADISA